MPNGPTHPKHPGFFQDESVFPAGRFEAWSTDDGTVALVLSTDGKTAKRFRGETAYQKAIRYAGDLNARGED